MNPVEQAVEVMKGQTALARAVGVTQPTVSEWLRGDRPVPVERCVLIERVTDGVVTRRHLRPTDWWRIWPELVTEANPIPVREAA